MANRTAQADAERWVRAHLESAFAGLDDPPPSRRGKVRDVYERGDELLLVATDRISAFDRVLGAIPGKGAMLTEQAAFWLGRAAAIVPTHLVERTDPVVMRCKKAAPLPIELVVRGWLAGSLLREPKETRGAAYGLRVDPAVADYARLPEPIVTPTTKELPGVHDQPMSLDDIAASGRVARRHLDRVVAAARALYDEGARFAAQQGLILVDTKYEFGLIGDEVVLIDEVHTADSSRFWIAATYDERRARGEAPEMLDKERLRRRLLDAGFDGHGDPPALTPDMRVDLAVHYWELTERVLGRTFAPPSGDPVARVRRALTTG